MSTRNRHHVVTHPDGWAVRREGSDKASAVLPTKDQAVDRAREIAQRERGGVVIHGENGRIQEERTYGDDPYPPPG